MIINMHGFKIHSKILLCISTGEESLVELSCDKILKAKAGSMELTKFQILIKNKYLLLSNKGECIYAGLKANSQLSNTNQCGKENESGRGQFDSQIWKMCNDLHARIHFINLMYTNTFIINHNN